MAGWAKRLIQTISCMATIILVAVWSVTAARADHGGPERVIDNAYVVSMTALLQEKPARMKFYFNDIQTGKRLTEPVRFTINVFKDGDAPPMFTSESIITEDGVGSFTYAFPNPGIYLLRLDVEFASAPGVLYQPEEWSLWVPGEGENTDRYPIGPSEISGFTLLFLSIVAVGINVWWRKHHR